MYFLQEWNFLPYFLMFLFCFKKHTAIIPKAKAQICAMAGFPWSKHRQVTGKLKVDLYLKILPRPGPTTGNPT